MKFLTPADKELDENKTSIQWTYVCANEDKKP